MTSKTNTPVNPFKNHQMPFGMRLYFAGLTATFKVLGLVSPYLAGKLALRLFMTPPNFGIPRRERKFRDQAKLTHLISRGRKISVRTWGDDNLPTVLLSHGWGGRCTQLQSFITPLVEAGYQVIGFDVPGHGDSEGKFSNMLDVASIISEIAQTQGPFEAIIGHSFGTGTALLSIDKFKVKSKKVILIAYFADVHFITQLFADLFSLRESTLSSMKNIALKTLGDNYGISWTWDEISPVHTIQSVSSDLFLIHDEKDTEVPFSQAEKLQQVSPKARVLNTSGLGHRKILMSKKVVKATLDFIQDSSVS